MERDADRTKTLWLCWRNNTCYNMLFISGNKSGQNHQNEGIRAESHIHFIEWVGRRSINKARTEELIKWVIHSSHINEGRFWSKLGFLEIDLHWTQRRTLPFNGSSTKLYPGKHSMLSLLIESPIVMLQCNCRVTMSFCNYVTTTRFTLIQCKFVLEFKCCKWSTTIEMPLDFVTECSHIDSVRSKGRPIGILIHWLSGWVVGWSVGSCNALSYVAINAIKWTTTYWTWANVCLLINHSILRIHDERLHVGEALKFANVLLVHSYSFRRSSSYLCSCCALWNDVLGWPNRTSAQEHIDLEEESGTLVLLLSEPTCDASGWVSGSLAKGAIWFSNFLWLNWDTSSDSDFNLRVDDCRITHMDSWWLAAAAAALEWNTGIANNPVDEVTSFGNSVIEQLTVSQVSTRDTLFQLQSIKFVIAIKPIPPTSGILIRVQTNKETVIN